MDIRAIIIAELEKQGRSRFWLAKMADVDSSTVYRFLAGTGDTSTENASAMLAALGLRIGITGKVVARSA